MMSCSLAMPVYAERFYSIQHAHGSAISDLLNPLRWLSIVRGILKGGMDAVRTPPGGLRRNDALSALHSKRLVELWADSLVHSASPAVGGVQHLQLNRGRADRTHGATVGPFHALNFRAAVRISGTCSPSAPPVAGPSRTGEPGLARTDALQSSPRAYR
jgi:hypothetical protein